MAVSALTTVSPTRSARRVSTRPPQRKKAPRPTLTSAAKPQRIDDLDLLAAEIAASFPALNDEDKRELRSLLTAMA